MSEALPKSLKRLIIANIIFAVILVSTAFGFSCFGFGGYPPLAALGGICLCGSMLSLPGFVVMVAVDVIFGFLLWKKVGLRILVPLGIFAIAFPAITLADNLGKKLSDSRFDKHFSKYEKVAGMITGGSLKIVESHVVLPSGYRDLALFGTVYVNSNDPNDPTNTIIEFMVGSGGFAGHIAYLYSSNGTIAKGSAMARRWHDRKQVRDHWFRASD
jgi:hypothetical protein